MPFKYQPGFFEELGKSAAVGGIVQSTTNDFAAFLRSGAPVDTGQYRSRFSTRMKFQKRAVGIVSNTDPGAMAIEAKTGYVARKIREFARGRR